MSKRALILACGAVLAGLPALAEDLTIVSKVEGPGGARTATTYITAEKYRHTDGHADSIMDFASGRIVTIDHDKKTYWEATLAEMKAAMQQAGEQMQKMQEEMKQNPQTAAMMQKVMGGMMGGPLGEVTVEKGKQPRKIAGYDCDEYVISIGTGLKTEVWATPALEPPAHMFDLREALAGAGNPMGQRFARLYDEMRKIKGYPLAETTTVSIMGTHTTSSEATEVRQGSIPASTFAVPSGYKKVEAPMKAMSRK